MAGMAQLAIEILTTPMGAITALVAITILVLFARWALSDQPHK